MNILVTDMTLVLDFSYLCQQLCCTNKMSLSMLRTINLNKSMTKSIIVGLHIYKKVATFYHRFQIGDECKLLTVGSIFSHPGLNLFLATLLLSCCKYSTLFWHSFCGNA